MLKTEHVVQYLSAEVESVVSGSDRVVTFAPYRGMGEACIHIVGKSAYAEADFDCIASLKDMKELARAIIEGGFDR